MRDSLKISGIDKGFTEIIEYLNEQGYKPFSSCDGIIKNHSKPHEVNVAYISFLKSDRITELMSAFLKDSETFNIKISSCTHKEPYYLYGNNIEGNTYSVYFSNKQGEYSNYFEKIIRTTNTRKINIQEEEKKKLIILDELLEKNKESQLSYSIEFNSNYQPYMNKSGKINKLSIRTKDEYGYAKDMNQLLNILIKKIDIAKKDENNTEKYDKDEFIISHNNNSECTIYFKEYRFYDIANLIGYISSIENQLKEVNYREPDYDIEYENNL